MPYERQDDNTRIQRRPPLKERQLQIMLGGLLRDETLFRQAAMLTPDGFAAHHRVYAALWATIREYFATHGQLPGQEALYAEWEARLAAIRHDEFSDTELEMLDDFLVHAWGFDTESIQPQVVLRYLRHYLSDRLTREMARDIDPLQLTPADVSAVLTRYQQAQARIDAIGADDDPEMQTVSFAALMAEPDVEQEWFIDGVLADPGRSDQTGNRIAGGGGPYKALKTRLMEDATVSLASGTPFLCHFAVPKVQNVLFISAESGRNTIKRHLREVCRARDIATVTDLPLHLYFRAPQLADDTWLTWLRQRIEQTQAAVTIIEPWYLSLLSTTNSSLAYDLHAMGAILGKIARVGDDTGSLIWVGAHTRKPGKDAAKASRDKPSEPLNLADLHGSGLAEFSSQWTLQNPIFPFNEDDLQRQHHIWLKVGGRAGHSGVYCVDAREGPVNAPIWQTRVCTRREFFDQEAGQRVQQASAELAAMQEQITQALRPLGEKGVAKGSLRRAGITGKQTLIDEAVDAMILAGHLHTWPTMHAGATCWRLRVANHAEFMDRSNRAQAQRKPTRGQRATRRRASS